MKNKIPIILLFEGLIIFSSCGPKIYQTKNAPFIAGQQQNIAILPPVVSITAHPKISPETLHEQQKTESVNFQNEMYSWLLRRKMQGAIKQEIVDIASTNALLKKAGYPETPLTPAEICTILEVDGVLTSYFTLSKPMSEGEAIAVAILFGWMSPTNEVGAYLSIMDCPSDEMIWNYEQKYSGSIGSSHARLVDQIMQDASRRMPY